MAVISLDLMSAAPGGGRGADVMPRRRPGGAAGVPWTWHGCDGKSCRQQRRCLGSMSRRPLTQVMKHSENSLESGRSSGRSAHRGWECRGARSGTGAGSRCGSRPSVGFRRSRRLRRWSRRGRTARSREWVGGLDPLSRVFQRGEVMQQRRSLARAIHGGLRIGTGHPGITFRSLCESPLLRQVIGAKVWARTCRALPMPAIKWITGTAILARTPVRRGGIAL